MGTIKIHIALEDEGIETLQERYRAAGSPFGDSLKGVSEWLTHEIRGKLRRELASNGATPQECSARAMKLRAYLIVENDKKETEVKNEISG